MRQENLARGLGIVGRAVESRPTLPVLANILLRTGDEGDARLRLSAMNMSSGLSISCWIGAQVGETGAITLPRNTLTDLVNNLSPERVDLSLEDSTRSVTVRCGANVSTLRGIDAGEFPLLPESNGSDEVSVPADLLRNMIRQTVFATAREDNRPVLTGVFTEFKDKVLTMAAADGYRLAVRTGELEQNLEEPRSMVIPGRALDEVARIISDGDDEVRITFPGERDIVLFHLNNVLVSSQLLEDRYPDFSAVIPNDFSTSTEVYTGELLRACKRAAIFARDASGSARVLVRPADNPSDPGEVVIAGKSNERGDNTDMVDAHVEGGELDISLNVDYLIDVLNVISDERVLLQSSGPPGPGVLKPKDREDFIHVIMPMARTG
ncbi:MAG: DNA polymerase III subunit beta [Anaerolineaceae bacterium]|nr:DNA polymerase III subunit beta [Anaerolineaceae bacterium]